MRLLIIAVLILFLSISSNAQDPSRFENEVKQLISKDDVSDDGDLYLFVGSSSIRFWGSLKEDFPGINILNRGFGGSTFIDLEHFKEELIYAYTPKKIFIYEGDNDISMDHPVDEIIKRAKDLAGEIKSRLPQAEIYFIAAKPSVARWDKKEAYLAFNFTLQSWASFEDGIHFIDVWTPMCDDDGEVMKNLFVGDNLHMNKAGYKIWKEVVKPYVEGD